MPKSKLRTSPLLSIYLRTLLIAAISLHSFFPVASCPCLFDCLYPLTDLGRRGLGLLKLGLAAVGHPVSCAVRSRLRRPATKRYF
ncbi:hypothetical protein VTI74DRAFT_1930 [Chaetomium olivicolor]